MGENAWRTTRSTPIAFVEASPHVNVDIAMVEGQEGVAFDAGARNDAEAARRHL
jgi:hypothetical protein